MQRILIGLATTFLLGCLTMTPASICHAVSLVQPVPVVTLAGAQVAMSAAVASAERLKAPCAIAVVDRSGTLVTFESLDGVRPGSADLAIGKAHAAALLQRPTIEIENNTNQGRIAFVTADLLALRGGVPLRDDDMVVGAIGVAGINKDNDVKIADEAAAVFTRKASHPAPAATSP